MASNSKNSFFKSVFSAHVIPFFFAFVIFFTSCTYLAIPDPLEIKIKHASREKIGIMITPNQMDDKVLYRKNPGAIGKAMKSALVEINKQENQFVLLDTLGDADGFDYNQEFVGLEKKNLIELKYSYQSIAPPIIQNIFGIFTLGILPIKRNYQFFISPIVFDGEGKSHSLKTIESPVISEWNSWFLFPFDSREAKEFEFLQNGITVAIYSAMEAIETNKISVSSFQTKINKLNLPFRMMLGDKVRCGSSLSFGYRTNIKAGSGKTMCKALVLFANKTDGKLILDSRNFRLKFKDKDERPIESIPRHNGEVENLVSVVTLDPRSSASQIPVALYFAPPASVGMPMELEYYDKNISEIPIFVLLEKTP